MGQEMVIKCRGVNKGWLKLGRCLTKIENREVNKELFKLEGWIKAYWD